MDIPNPRQEKESKRLASFMQLLWMLYGDEMSSIVFAPDFGASLKSMNLGGSGLHPDINESLVNSEERFSDPLTQAITNIASSSTLDMMNNCANATNYGVLHYINRDALLRMFFMGYIVGKHEPDIISMDNKESIGKLSTQGLCRWLRMNVYPGRVDPQRPWFWQKFADNLDTIAKIFDDRISREEISLADARNALSQATEIFLMSEKGHWKDYITMLREYGK